MIEFPYTIKYPAQSLAYSVIMQAIADATRQRTKRFCPKSEEKERAILFLKGMGRYEKWLKFWCSVIQTDYKLTQNQAKDLQY